MALHSVWDVVDGIRVHGRVSDPAAASRDGGPPAVVFVHGLGMSTRYLEPTMLAAAALGFTVSALDLPGFGETRLPGRVLSLGELASVLVGWLRVRAIVAPILVGQSHGCQVIVEAIMREPGLASAVLLNAPTMLAGHRSVLAMLGRVAIDAPREPLALIPHVVRDYLRAGPMRILRTLDEALRDRIEEKLPHVGVPVMIVCGARDPVSPPAWGSRLASLVGFDAVVGMPTAMSRSVPGAAHAVPFSHPEVVSGEIAELADRLRSTARVGRDASLA
jgi:pimeloyl-ACP methyl ester carboxylesterase